MMIKSILISTSIFALATLSSCGDKGKTKASPAATVAQTGDKADAAPTGAKLAYVNADTLNKYYLYLKDKEAAFEKKQSAYQAEMAKKEKALASEYQTFQKKAQEGTLTQTEGEAAQKRLGQQQQALEQRHASITTDLAKEQAAMQDEFQERLDNFLEGYNQDKGYDFILTYSKNGGGILYANKSLDITQEVLDAMNEDYKNGNTKANSKATDTTKR